MGKRGAVSTVSLEKFLARHQKFLALANKKFVSPGKEPVGKLAALEWSFRRENEGRRLRFEDGLVREAAEELAVRGGVAKSLGKMRDVTSAAILAHGSDGAKSEIGKLQDVCSHAFIVAGRRSMDFGDDLVWMDCLVCGKHAGGLLYHRQRKEMLNKSLGTPHILKNGNVDNESILRQPLAELLQRFKFLNPKFAGGSVSDEAKDEEDDE